MLPYLIFLIIILLCYYKRNPIGILITMVLFSVLRYDTGWDYASYIDTVRTPAEWAYAEFSKFSLLWRWLFEFSYNIHFPHFTIAFTNALTYIIVYHALKLLNLNRTDLCKALIVYALWCNLYLGTFSVIRQSISIGLGLLMFAYIQRQSYIKSGLCFLIAVHLHTSAVILIVLYPIYLLRNRLNFKSITICSILVTLGILNIFRLLENIPLFHQYLIYLGGGGKYGGLLVYMDLLFFLYLGFALYRQPNLSTTEIQCFFIGIIAFLGRLTIFYAGLSIVISRIFDYFAIFIIPIILPSLKIFKDQKTITNITVGLLGLYFIAYLLITARGAQVASSGFVPYKCILFN